MSGPQQPFEQQPGESQAAFRGFCLYRDMGPAGRSIDAVADAIRGQPRGSKRATGRVTKWSSDHRWVERARAFDAWADGEKTRSAVQAMADAAGLTVARTLRARHDHLRRMMSLTDRVIRKGELYISFPAADKMIDGDGGPTLVKAVSVREAAAGARLAFAGHEVMMGLYAAALRTAAPALDAPGPASDLPTADEARAVDLARLEAAAAWVYAAACQGDRDALADLIRLQERKAKLLGLDIGGTAHGPPIPSGPAAPAEIEEVRPADHEPRDDAGGEACPP